VVIELAVTREGIPVRVWVWPGNTNDQTVITQVKDDLRGWRLGRCVWVVDRGFSSDENLRSLTRAGGHWIAGERMRDGSPDAQAALARPGRYQTVRDNLRVKDVRVGEGDNAHRFVVCHTRSRPSATRPSATRTSPGSRLSSRGSNRPGGRRRPARPVRRTPAPSARCATTRPSPATYARPRPAGC
jgi:Transposase DDE domain